jgi:Histidine phosphatase superfamily (branch 2)
MPFNNTEE